MGMAAKYNLGAADTPTAVHTELHHASRGGLDDQVPGMFWHPDSPLFWVAAIAAVTVGLAAVSGSGSIKIGPVHASASAGAGK